MPSMEHMAKIGYSHDYFLVIWFQHLSHMLKQLGCQQWHSELNYHVVGKLFDKGTHGTFTSLHSQLDSEPPKRLQEGPP